MLAWYLKLGHRHFNIKLTPRRRVLEELLGPYESGNTIQLTETTGLLPFLHEPAYFPCSEPDESNTGCSAVSPGGWFNYCAHCMRRSSKCSLFRFSNPNTLCVSFFSAPCLPHAAPILPSMSLLNYCSLITLPFDTVSSEILNTLLNNVQTNEELNAEITDYRSA